MTDQKYTVWERVCFIRHQMATAAAEPCAYKSWPDDFSRENLREAWTASDLGGLTEADFRTLDPEQIKGVFGQWDSKLWLIPLWLRPWIANGQNVINIFGKVDVLTDETDLDHRGGYIAYGWELLTPEVEEE